MGIRKLIQRCPRPILTIPGAAPKFERLLVAYNGSPKAAEALYAAAYFAGRWVVPLIVLTIAEPDQVKPKTINRARYYLRSQGIKTTFIQENGNVSETILKISKDNQVDLIVKILPTASSMKLRTRRGIGTRRRSRSRPVP